MTQDVCPACGALPCDWVNNPCDSGRHPQGENSRSEVEGEACQSGGVAASPNASGDWNAAIEADLLPCAHCGSGEVSMSYSATVKSPEPHSRFVECEACAASGPPHDISDYSSDAEAKIAAITAWNTRQPTTPTTGETFQQRVQPWMMECFGAEIAGDREERNHRFLEEALELVQSLGCTASEAHQLVDYVYGRPVGDPKQESGGVSVTHAALCLANEIDMHEAGEAELARIWTKVEAIRAKQAAKPKHSPLPIAPTTGEDDVEKAARALALEAGIPYEWESYVTDAEAVLAAISPTTEDAEKRKLAEALKLAVARLNHIGDEDFTVMQAAHAALASIGERS